MPAGTWNLPDIRKTVPFRGIFNRQSITIFDTTALSDNYFNIIDFPDRFTAGKNLFKLNAANNTLVDGSEVQIEILDFNGNPIYFEPLDYLEQDGTRVIAVYIYPDTAPGLATIYITGRARFNVFEDPILNNPLPFSETPNGGDLYKNYPNLLWTRTINIAPEKFNTTEIIYTQQPKVTVVERVVNYQEPITLNNINVSKPGNGGTITIENIPGNAGVTTANLVNNIYQSKSTTRTLTGEGQASSRTPLGSYGLPFSLGPTFTGVSPSFNVNDSKSIVRELSNNRGTGSSTGVGTGTGVGVGSANVPTTQTSTGITTVTGVSRMTTTGFPLSSSMEGGNILIKNPKLQLQLGTLLTGSKVISVSDIQDLGKDINNFVPTALSAENVEVELSGSIVLVINEVESTTQAKVSQIAGPGHNSPTLTPFKVTLAKSNNGRVRNNGTISNPIAYDITEIKSSTEFTSSHSEPLVYATTEQSQSFAEVVLSNIEPATGDVHKIRTSYKPLGQFGDFISAGDTVLERLELLEDTSSFEGTVAIGQIYNRMGYFTDINDVNTYFIDLADVGAGTPGVINSELTFEPQNFQNAVVITPDNAYDTRINRLGAGIQLKSQYLPEVKMNSNYAVRFKLKCLDDDLSSSFLKYPNNNVTKSEINKPRFDVYISGSSGKGTIQPAANNFTAYRTTKYDIDETLINNFADDNLFGKYIGTVEMEKTSITDVLFNFISTQDQTINISLISRAGKFAVKDIGITADAETGFSPNHARLNIRIPSVYINVPMSFKFEFFDYLGTKADNDVIVFPIKFLGENDVISGTNNLITGSIFIGNTVGSGIEIAGVSSGFIRSVGYEGFLSGSDPNKPGGFLMYTGSVLPDSPDGYTGVGLEIIQDSGSFLRFATSDNVSDRSAGLDVRTPRFFFGGDDNFISGSNGKIEITSSNFHLDNAGNVTMQGNITANEGTIGGFAITQTAISSSNNSLILRGNNGQITASSVLIDGGRITSGVTIEGSLTANTILTPSTINGSPATIENASSSIDAGGFARFESASIASFVVNTEEIKSTNNNLRLKNTGQITGSDVLFEGGTVAGWTIDNEKFQGGNMIIRQDGTIESANFVSNVAGSGFKLTAAQGGFLEVENARIRGTLATTTFEKETVNAVGGQLYVANSTTLTSSAVAPQGIHSASMATMSVVNVTGFAANEIITAKKISSTGFATEYMLVESASRADSSSDTDFSGFLFVRRGYSGSAPASSGSLGDPASSAQSYSGSQVIVSTGKVGTGYIRLNANPNDSTTPYIDIVERTGNAIYEVDLKARLGDLSGVSDSVGGRDVSGFGLYTDNAFLKGGIVATYGQIGGFGISSTTISSSNNNLILASDGTITASDARLEGHISASSGTLGGWTIADGKLGSQAIAPNTYRMAVDGANLRIHISQTSFGSGTGISLEYNGGTPRFFAGSSGNHVKFDGSKLIIASDNFDIDASGNVTMTGTVTATAGSIGGFSIDASTISSSNDNLILRSNGQITASDMQLSGGIVQSSNFSDASGSRINLNDGSINFGGSSGSSFAVDTEGNVTASNALIEGEVIAGNLTERYTVVADSNRDKYCRYVSGHSASGVFNLVFDGSLGGDITSNMEISTSAAFTIQDVELPFTGSNRAQADVFIQTAGMTFDEATIAPTFKQLLINLNNITLTGGGGLERINP